MESEERIMSNQTSANAARVGLGVDTHRDEHVAVAIDQLGLRLGDRYIATTTKGYADLERWAMGQGEIVAFGVEGTGSYGAGLARFLATHGHIVIEVSRPDRSTRRRLGKSDPIDAEAAARAVLAGVAKGNPKAGNDSVEMLRMLKSTKDSAIKARTQAINQMKAFVVTAPLELRQKLRGLSSSRLVARCVAFRSGVLDTSVAVAKHTLRSLARRHRQLTSEIREIETELGRLTSETAPALVNTFGVGPNTAATLLITAGSNPERLRSESAFAALCGVAPIPASSGNTHRHRLSRGGDRQANAAIHQIVIVRLCHDERTRQYMDRRVREGMKKTEIIRCLKRYVAREVFALLPRSQQPRMAVAS
jgi:transposase